MPTVIVALLPGDGKGVVDSGSVSHYVWKGIFALGTVEYTPILYRLSHFLPWIPSMLHPEKKNIA